MALTQSSYSLNSSSLKTITILADLTATEYDRYWHGTVVCLSDHFTPFNPLHRPYPLKPLPTFRNFTYLVHLVFLINWPLCLCCYEHGRILSARWWLINASYAVRSAISATAGLLIVLLLYCWISNLMFVLVRLLSSSFLQSAFHPFVDAIRVASYGAHWVAWPVNFQLFNFYSASA